MNYDNLFCCPECKSNLNRTDKYYSCENCITQYAIIHNVAVFMTKKLDSDKMNEFWDQGWQNRLQNTDHQFLVKENKDQLLTRMLNNLEIKKQFQLGECNPNYRR